MNQMKGRIFNLRQPSSNDNGGQDNADDEDGDVDADDESDDGSDDDSELGDVANQACSVGARPNPMGAGRSRRALRQTARGNVAAQNEMFNNIRMAIGVFQYINHPDALPTIQRNRRELRTAITLISQAVPSLRNAAAIQREFDSNWYREAADRTRAWVAAGILDIHLRFGELERTGQLPPNSADVRDITEKLEEKIKQIQPPPDI